MRRRQALKAAANVFTGSQERMATGLPFEPVDRARLDRLRAEREAARASANTGAGRFVNRRRRAQIEARHVLASLAAGLRQRHELPESWLPFVVGG